MNDQTDERDSTRNVKTSKLLADVLAGLNSPHIEIGELMQQFQRRSYGGVFLILALLAMVPGISILAGLALIVPAAQLLMGLPSPVFPSIISKRKVGVASLQKWGIKVCVWVERLETFVKPRLMVVTNPAPRRLIGFVIILLAMVVAIPFPFSNFPPAVATICFALGLLERDGLMVILASIVSAIAFTVGFTVFVFIVNWFMQLIM